MTDAELGDALKQIFSFSLARRTAEGDSFSIHPLVHTMTLRRLDGKQKTMMANEAIYLLGSRLATSRVRWKLEQNLRSHLAVCVRNAMDYGALQRLVARWKGLRYAPAWAAKIVNHSILQLHRYPDHAFVRLLDEIARTCDDYGLQCAKDIRQVTLEWSTNILGIDDFWTLRRMTSLGITLHQLDELEEAKTVILRALERHDILWPSHTPNYHTTLDALHNVAVTLRHQNRFEEAEELYRLALERREKILGPDHTDTLSTLHNLAFTLSGQKRFEEAEGLYRLALERRGKILGPDHTDTLSTLHNLSFVLSDLSRSEEAEGLYRLVLKRQENTLGPDSADTLTTLHNLALTLSYLNKFEEAEKIYRLALGRQEKILGPDHTE